MTSLALPSTPILFPTIPTAAWYITPQIHKRHPNPYNHRKQEKQTWMGPWSNDQQPPQQQQQAPLPPVQTGPEHWEEQRRRWTQNFPASRYSTDDDVRLKNAGYDRLVRYYKEITTQERPFRRPIRLSLLIRILVAGWKDAGMSELPRLTSPLQNVYTRLWPEEETLRREILQKRLNPEDYDLTVHLSSVLDSDKLVEQELDVAVSRLLARQNGNGNGKGKGKDRTGDVTKE